MLRWHRLLRVNCDGLWFFLQSPTSLPAPLCIFLLLFCQDSPGLQSHNNALLCLEMVLRAGVARTVGWLSAPARREMLAVVNVLRAERQKSKGPVLSSSTGEPEM